MSGENGIDASTQFWMDQGGSDPIVERWSETREHVNEHSGDEGWKDRDDRDREEAVVAAIDETRSRQTDREDWDEGRQYRDFVTERWPGTKIPDYIQSRLRWNDAFRQDPARAQELWVREWQSRSPFRDEPKPKPKAEPAPDLTRDGLVEWEREQAVRDALATVTGDRADADDFEATADLRALVREKTGLSLSKFLERCCAVDEASFNDPYSVAARFARFNGLPATQAHADEMVQAAQYQQASEAAGAWLDGLEQQGRLPEDFKHLERDVGDVLEFMNANNMRTDDLEADLGNAINWARDRVIARQQQANTPSPPTSMLQGVMRGVSPELAEHVEKAKVAKARFASRSVTGSAPSGTSGPVRRPNMSYDADLHADAAAAYREASGRA